MRLTSWAAPLALATVLLTSACEVHACVGSGCPGKIDAAKAERETKAVIAKQTGGNVATVTCPKGVEEKTGATFTCTAVGADGTRTGVLITQKDDKGNVHISAPNLLHTGNAARLIADRLTRQLKFTVRVRCPDLINVHKGSTLTCSATDPVGKTRTVDVTVTDDQGAIDYGLR